VCNKRGTRKKSPLVGTIKRYRGERRAKNKRSYLKKNVTGIQGGKTNGFLKGRNGHTISTGGLAEKGLEEV